MEHETRVRMNASQTAKGYIQLDVTAEAPTVEEAKSLLGSAIDALCTEVEARKLTLAHKAG